ncbi:unnamed protein product [Dibothriocephalus latus]|uniref:PARG catalytic Macro domain-containing protein n=1 Tax=Dibothriocephalus latus TaxID=60516 RepID=A0A3P7P9D4_DIBLA|nr:unnamed protein product [Dibothriocephalus latus]
MMCCMQPEILAGRLFMECLLPREAALVIGAERFCSCTGYARHLAWAEDFREADHGTVRDARGRWNKFIVAIDATRLKISSAQFQESYLCRELNKAFIGFTDMAAPYERLPSTVVSGNWGCGVFRGSKALKALLQLMACAQARKALAYSTFEDESLEKEL